MNKPILETENEYPVGFGHTMHCLELSVQGSLDKHAAEVLTRCLITDIEMREGPGSATFCYPGKVGFIHIRTLIESYITVDSWHPMINGAYISIHSCKEFTAEAVERCLRFRGLTILESKWCELTIP